MFFPAFYILAYPLLVCFVVVASSAIAVYIVAPLIKFLGLSRAARRKLKNRLMAHGCSEPTADKALDALEGSPETMGRILQEPDGFWSHAGSLKKLGEQVTVEILIFQLGKALPNVPKEVWTELHGCCNIEQIEEL